MNLKDLDPKLFQERLERYATEMKDRFERELSQRVDELRSGIADVARWDLPKEMAELFALWFSKDATVFAASFPNPDQLRSPYGTEEAVVRLRFGPYDIEVGRVQNLNSLLDSKILVFFVPDPKKGAKAS